MKSGFSTFAPVLALGLLALAGSAYKYGEGAKTRAVSARADEAVARGEMESARDALVWVSALPSGSGPGEVVTERNLELARAVPLVAAIARKNGVKIASFGTSGGVAGNASKFESIFVPVPMTGDRLYKADVLLRGEYESYKSLLDFFDELRNSGVAVQSASIKGKAIDAVVRVAGV